MTHVFSLDAIATCEQRGHAFAWVETWHGIGFDECSRCGATGATRERSAGILPGATVDAPTYDWDSVRKHEAGQWCAATERDLANLAKPGGVVFVAPPSREPRRSPPSPAGRTRTLIATSRFAPAPPPRPPKASGEHAERDADVRRRMAAGESVKAIALAHGISPARVYQIAPARAGASQ